MKTLLFNIDDIPILLTIFECSLLGVLVLFVNKVNQTRQYLLSLFLFALGLDAFATIIYWSSAIREQFFADSTYIFYVFGFARLLTGPSLFFYIKSILYRDFKFGKKEAIHFIPAAIFPFYLLFVFGYHDEALFIAAKTNFEILFHDKFYHVFILTKNISYIAYGVYSLKLLIDYREKLKQGYSNIDDIDHSWLKIIVGGYLLIWSWHFGSYIAHIAFEKIGLADHMGVIGNHLIFVFVNTLVTYSLVKSQLFQGIDESESKEPQYAQPDKALIGTLENAMEVKALYLDPELTLEQLARDISSSPRQVSNTINRCFNKNFFEFVNDYRVEKAKTLLQIDDPSLTMLSIMEKSGFNSKSTFNRFFKKSTGMTPTEYKKAAPLLCPPSA